MKVCDKNQWFYGSIHHKISNETSFDQNGGWKVQKYLTKKLDKFKETDKNAFLVLICIKSFNGLIHASLLKL